MFNNSIKLFSFFNIPSYSNGLFNEFCVFNSIYNKHLLICKTQDKKGLIFFDLILFNILKKFDNLHQDGILCIKHYLKNNKDIIITSSWDNVMNIIDVNKNFEIIKIIKNIGDNDYNGDYSIYSFILLNDYIITNNYDDNYLKIFDYNSCKFIKNIFPQLTGIGYIESYYDKNKNKNYIITCNRDYYNSYVRSYSFEDECLYQIYTNRVVYNIVINDIKKKINIIFSSFDKILFYDFHNGDCLDILEFNNYKFNTILFLNKEYIICGENKEIIIINIKKKKIIEKLECHQNEIFNLKKLKINNYEYLFTQAIGSDKIIIWKNNQ